MRHQETRRAQAQLDFLAERLLAAAQYAAAQAEGFLAMRTIC